MHAPRLAAELALIASAVSCTLAAFGGTGLSAAIEHGLWHAAGGYVAGYATGLILARVAEERAEQVEADLLASREPPAPADDESATRAA